MTLIRPFAPRTACRPPQSYFRMHNPGTGSRPGGSLGVNPCRLGPDRGIEREGHPVKAPLLAAALLPALAASAARADDRRSCGRPGLDLVCETVGAGFHAVPQKPGSLSTYY